MNKRLLSYAKILKDRLNNDGCMFIAQKVSEFGIIQEYHRNAIDSKLLECSINGATGVIMNVTGGPDMTLFEVNEAASVIHDAVSDIDLEIYG